ncbi:MAG: hypothetical protein ABFD76_04210 [Smithella sp.]
MEENDLMNYEKKWFVLHHNSLYNENPNLIGFRDPTEWRMIKVGDLIVYYQAGKRQLRGIYEVIKTDINIDLYFGKNEFLPGELKHQHELKLLQRLSANFRQGNAQQLSFHKDINNPTRWDNKRVFRIDNNDLAYLLSM